MKMFISSSKPISNLKFCIFLNSLSKRGRGGERKLFLGVRMAEC